MLHFQYLFSLGRILLRYRENRPMVVGFVPPQLLNLLYKGFNYFCCLWSVLKQRRALRHFEQCRIFASCILPYHWMTFSVMKTIILTRVLLIEVLYLAVITTRSISLWTRFHQWSIDHKKIGQVGALISWLAIPSLIVSPGNHQAWYWLCEHGSFCVCAQLMRDDVTM